MRTKSFILCFQAGLLLQAAGIDTPALWNYAHPEARVLVGIDFQKARVSPAGKLMMRQVSTQLPKNPNADLLDAVDRVLVSAPVPPTGGLTEDSPFLIAIQGKLPPLRVKKMMAQGTGIERFRGADLYVPPKSAKSEVVLAMVNESLWLMGDRPSVEQVLEAVQTNGSSRPAPDLVERASAMAAVNEFWVVAMPPREAIVAATKASGPNPGVAMPGMKFLEDIENMDLGVSLQRGLGLNLGLGMRTEESARMLSGMAQMGAGMAVQEVAKTNPELAGILRSLRFVPEKNLVRMRLDVSVAQLQRGMSSMAASMAKSGPKSIEDFLGMRPGGRPSLGGFSPPPQTPPVAQSWPAAAPSAPPAPPPKPVVPEKRTIRIVGLEDGTREVSYMSGGKQ